MNDKNLSKQKRESVLKALEQIRNDLSNDVLKSQVNMIESFVTENKFGLIFEKHSEDVLEKIKDQVPVFFNSDSKEIISKKDGNYNFILEGDNLHSLYLLSKTHKKTIDLIYIDPPYNNGSKDWKYNNDFIDSNDGYRHSKWLSMMNERLLIAKKLLKSDGVMICAIDENELATLILLFEEVFGLEYKIDIICIVHNPRGVQGNNFSYTNEYALFVYKKGLSVIEPREIQDEEIDWRDLRDNGHESLRTDAANCFYSINVNKNLEIVGFGPNKTRDESFHPKKNETDKDSIVSIYPIDKEGVERKWRYSLESVGKIKHLLRVKKIKDQYDIELGKNFGTYKTVWTDKKYDSNENGTKIINDIVPSNDFDFPKSLYNVYDCLYSVIKNKPKAVVLDFFAGSGTTGHAVLLMNKLIGGERNFILCTNNDIGDKREKEFIEKHPDKADNKKIDKSSKEYLVYEEKYGIASSITYPRIANVIKGYNSKSGLKTILYEEKLSSNLLFNDNKLNSLKKEVEKITEDNKKEFSIIKKVVEENTFRLYGQNEKNDKIQGLSGNLMYFKTGFVNKFSNTQELTSELNKSIYEMICLKHMKKISKDNIIFNDDQLEETILKLDTIEDKVLYVYPHLLLTEEEIDLIKASNFQIVRIPEGFYKSELSEAGEL